MRFAIPVLILVGLVVLFAVGLQLDPTKVPSPLIGKAAPAFKLAALEGAGALSETDLKGRPVLVNFWASWCTPCLQEHALLLEMKQAGVPIVGIVYKDTPENAQRWLAQHGNAWQRLALDPEGKAGLDWGVYGVPETYLVDAEGVIRFKQVGPLTREVWERDLKPALAAR